MTMTHEKTMTREKARQLDRAMEARLAALVEGCGEDSRISRYYHDALTIGGTRHDRARLTLWFISIAAVVKRRDLVRPPAEVIVDAIYADRFETPYTRAIYRVHTLLVRLIVRGCRRRGELAPKTTSKTTTIKTQRGN